MLRRNRGLGVLDGELKQRNPGIVVGWIGDRTHAVENPDSDHNPKKLNGDEVVNALDPMIGPAYSMAEADEDIRRVRANPDAMRRVKYIIWKKRIMAGPKGPMPGVWREYDGNDPHTGHWHISALDSADTNERPWLIPAPGVPMKYETFSVSMPILVLGTSDDDYPGWNLIERIQDLRGLTPDGDFGPKTAASIKQLGLNDGRVIDEKIYRAVLGLKYP